MRENLGIRHTTNWLPALLLAVMIVPMSMMMGLGNLSIGFAIAFLPFAFLVLILIAARPFVGFLVLFIANYFIIPLQRYTDVSGFSVMVDILILITFVFYIVNAVFIRGGGKTHSAVSGLTLVAFLWLIYCVVELFNPTADTRVWFLSRGLIYYLLAMCTMTFILFRNFRMVNTILLILSVLTLIGVAKGLMQKFVGFDSAERALLDSGLYKTHLLRTGIRYFSIYASAGIFGAVMGHALVLYTIVAIYTSNKVLKIYYYIVATLALYGMMISGTRGALAVPAAGFFLFVILSKNLKVMIPSTVFLIGAYVFLAFTTIGQSNGLIRRMRTAFNPNEPSLMVRKENQKKLALYLENRPFGEGLGLSGVDDPSVAGRFTTSIPTDSWYVKIWVETGIVGLTLYIAMMVYIIMHGCYIIFFKVKSREIRAVLMGLLCAAFGILVSSYGNQVLGQFPVAMIVYVSMALVFMGPYFDKQMAQSAIEK